jgi:hypothetical protein
MASKRLMVEESRSLSKGRRDKSRERNTSREIREGELGRLVRLVRKLGN